MGTPPQRGAGSPGHRPLSQRLQVEKTPCVGCGFWFCRAGFGCFWAGGGASVLITLSCMFRSAALQYRINARKGARKASFAPPPNKLSHSEAKV